MTELAERAPARPAPAPVRRSPVGERRLAHGRMTVASGSLATSAAGTPSANAASSASSYSSVAELAAHQTLMPSSERSVLSQCPPDAGRRSPSSVRPIAVTRRPIEFSVAPM